MKSNRISFFRNSIRPLCPKELDGELIILCILPVTALLAALWLNLGLVTPKCLLHEWTGIPCLTCGSTRAFGSLLTGHWLAALRWNPLTTLAFVFWGMVWIYSAIVCLFRLRRFRPMLSRRVQNGLRVAIVLLVTVNWIYLIFTLP